MSEEFYVLGEAISEDQLTLGLAQELAKAVKRYPFATLIDTRRWYDLEILVCEFQVELPQRPLVEIFAEERIAIQINPDINLPPRISALRKSFPETLHQNLVLPEEPKDLCVFDEFYVDLKDHLTPIQLLQKINQWLAKAAIEELHQPNQPLEPLLLSRNHLILDPEKLSGQHPNPAIVYKSSESPLILRAYHNSGNDFKSHANYQYLLLLLRAPPWTGRIIHYNPRNFGELARLFSAIQLDLPDMVCNFVSDLSRKNQLDGYRPLNLILLLELPKQRFSDEPAEEIERWAFLLCTSIEDLALKSGTLGFNGRFLVPLIGASGNKELLNNIPVVALKPTFALTPTFARTMSGSSTSSPNIVAIGAGTLGSQVILNLGRQGFGTWFIVDNDILLPHNYSRHGLTSQIYEGQNKAFALSIELQNLLNNAQVSQPSNINILYHKENEDDLTESFQASELILDFSASRSVTRFIATLGYPAPRLSAFFGAGGQFCTLLFEGVGRRTRLDDLEMQFASAIAIDDRFSNFYSKPNAILYVASCRDASIQLPQDIVALHCGAVASFIKEAFENSKPQILIWEWSATTFSLSCIQIAVYETLITLVNDWVVRTSYYALEQMQAYRSQRSPNETGGVLIGRIDHSRRTIFIATVLTSPSDSEEWPDYYRRGIEGLHKEIETLSNRTGRDLNYIGEWHTHPIGYNREPSKTDLEAHHLLSAEMGKQGLPGVVAILGDQVEPYFLIELL